MCSLILLYTLRKINLWSRTAGYGLLSQLYRIDLVATAASVIVLLLLLFFFSSSSSSSSPSSFSWLINCMVFWTVFKLYRCDHCSYPCSSGVLSTSTPPNILSKPQAAFPHNHCRNNGQQWERNESFRNDTINPRREYFPCRGPNQRPPFLKSCALPTELLSSAFLLLPPLLLPPFLTVVNAAHFFIIIHVVFQLLLLFIFAVYAVHCCCCFYGGHRHRRRCCWGGRWFGPLLGQYFLQELMVLTSTGFIPFSSPLSVVSTMAMWESSQWLGKNIVRSTG